MLIAGWLIPPLQRKVIQYAQQFLLLFATECQSSKHRTGTDQCTDFKIIQYEFSEPYGMSDSVNLFSFLLPLSAHDRSLKTCDIHKTFTAWLPKPPSCYGTLNTIHAHTMVSPLQDPPNLTKEENGSREYSKVNKIKSLKKKITSTLWFLPWNTAYFKNSVTFADLHIVNMTSCIFIGTDGTSGMWVLY